jgi:hypothetical protein
MHSADEARVTTEPVSARTFCVILFPAYLEARVIALLDALAVPGYSRAPNVVGRGPHGRHFGNQVWPGVTGEIFTALDEAGARVLADGLAGLDAELQQESHGLHAVHLFSWPCQAVL